jgi:small subunit ribosomal protein S18
MKNDVCTVDYKDIRTLSKLVTPQGKLFSRKRSGACAYCQRQIKTAVKRARFLALLPYVGR